jgi:hypothetical protein
MDEEFMAKRAQSLGHSPGPFYSTLAETEIERKGRWATVKLPARESICTACGGKIQIFSGTGEMAWPPNCLQKPDA